MCRLSLFAPVGEVAGSGEDGALEARGAGRKVRRWGRKEEKEGRIIPGGTKGRTRSSHNEGREGVGRRRSGEGRCRGEGWQIPAGPGSPRGLYTASYIGMGGVEGLDGLSFFPVFRLRGRHEGGD
jgi:hypothetical protein